MHTISDIKKEYFGKIDPLDLDLILAHTLKKPREFVLAHPEHVIPELKIENLKFKITRRRHDEPLAYILGYKEFFGHPFLVTPATLIPRPETELMVEEALAEVISHQSSVTSVIDVGTGSGNIIISILKNLIIDSKFKIQNSKFFAIDISKDALRVAKRNAKKNNVEEKIKFLHGNLLEPIMKKLNRKSSAKSHHIIILANLPYLSNKIYNSTAPNVKKFEPKSALYSPKDGLDHYEKLFQQIKLLQANETSKLTTLTAILEISPEQKVPLKKMITKPFPKAKTFFKKDLAGRIRMAIISL